MLRRLAAGEKAGSQMVRFSLCGEGAANCDWGVASTFSPCLGLRTVPVFNRGWYYFFFFFEEFVLLPDEAAGFFFASGFFPAFFSGSGVIFLNER